MIYSPYTTRAEFLEDVYDCFVDYEHRLDDQSTRERLKCDLNHFCYEWYMAHYEVCEIKYGEYASSDIYPHLPSNNHTFRTYIPDTILGKMVYATGSSNYCVIFQVLNDFVIRLKNSSLDTLLIQTTPQ